jgi:hypothetical protein
MYLVSSLSPAVMADSILGEADLELTVDDIEDCPALTTGTPS